MLRLPPSKPHPELDELLRMFQGYKLSPVEIWDQRVSFAYGQMMDCAPKITKSDIEARAMEMYGPRPCD